MRALATTVAILLVALGFAQTSRDGQARARYRLLGGIVNRMELEESLIAISLAGSRLAGSEGEAKTLGLAERMLREYGFRQIQRMKFPVAIPDPASVGTLATPDGKSLNLYPLWPNLVTPSSCDIRSSTLLDGQRLDGQEVRGHVVLLPFGSQDAWRRAAKLGAAAVVYCDDGRVTRTEAELKVGDAPVRVPRFYFGGSRNQIRGLVGQKISLSCNQRWIQAESANVEAVLPGDTDETIMLAAYADAMSVTPGINPGAQQGSGLAALLETIRILKDQPRKRTIRVVVFGSHWLGLRGAREYVANWGTRSPIVAGLTLDLSTGSGTLGSFGRGWFYETRDETNSVVGQLSRILREHASVMWDQLGMRNARDCLIDTVNNSDSRPWKNSVPGRIAVDSEPFVLAQLPVLTLATTEDARRFQDTPFDTLDRANLNVLVSLTRRIVCLTDHLVNDSRERGDASNYRLPTQPSLPKRLSLLGGFGTVEGKTLMYDPAKSFVPSVPVAGALAVALGRHSNFMGVRGDLVSLTDSNGGFRFEGLPLVNTYLDQNRIRSHLAAYTLAEDGVINSAPAEGLMGSSDYPTQFDLTTTRRSSPLVLFPCRTVDLIAIHDPQTFQPLTSFDLLDARTNGSPPRYGVFQRSSDPRNPTAGDGDTCLFVEPRQKFHVAGRNREGELRFLLKNQTAEAFAESAEAVNAADLLASTNDRLARFSKYRIVSPAIADLQKRAVDAEHTAGRASKEQKWTEAERQTRASWGYALRTYPIIRGLAGDVVFGVLFYLLMLMPFSYFAERLIFGSRKLTTQLALTVGIFCLAFLVLRLIHPAFEIMPNPWIVFIAFVMAALSLFVAVFLLGKFDASLTTSRAVAQGVQEADVRRAGVAMAAFQVGIAGMRHRKLRTTLTTMTLVAMTFIVLSFTSIVPEILVRTQPSERAAAYSGLLVRAPDLGPLSPALVGGFANEAGPGARLSRRATFDGVEATDSATLSVSAGSKIIDFRAVQGIDPGEPLAQESDLASGRWFAAGDHDVVVLPKSMATSLGIGVGQSVEFAGTQHNVVGIVDETKVATRKDLDGDGLLPPDFSASRQLREQSRSASSAFLNFKRLDPATCLFAPTDDVLELSGVIRSVAITQANISFQELIPRLRLNLYAANSQGKVDQFSAVPGSRGTGFGMVLIQMAIAALFVLNTMIAGVYERRREIGILSSIGLAPNHIGAMFFAESSVYGVLGAVLGYFAAQATAKVMILTGSMQSLQLNFSSTSAVLSAGIVMVVVLLSTIYPAKVAARIAAPAREESILNEPPDGDVWNILLPFTIGEQEAPAALSHLASWLAAHEQFSLGTFVTEQNASSADAVTGVAWLAPFDLGVSQELSLTAIEGGAPGSCALRLTVTRLSGEPKNWVRANERFIESFRRQFLAWRTQPRDQSYG